MPGHSAHVPSAPDLKIALVPSYYPDADDPVRGHFFAAHAEALRTAHEVHIVSPPPLTPLPLFCGYVARALRRLRPDVIHAHVAVPGGVAALLAARMLGLPVALTEHAGPLDTLYGGSRVRRRLVGRLLSEVDGLAIPSLTLAAEIWALGVRRTPSIIPNPVLLDNAEATPQPFSFLAVGLMDDRTKGFEHLLTAWAASDRPAGARLRIVGSGRLQSEYVALAARLGVAESALFLGRRSPQETIAEMRRADAFVSASVYESFGYAAAEAAACGVPVIATRVGAMAGFLRPEHGILVDPGNAGELAAGIERFARERTRFDRARLAVSARESFGPTRVCELTTRMLSELPSHRR